MSAAAVCTSDSLLDLRAAVMPSVRPNKPTPRIRMAHITSTRENPDEGPKRLVPACSLHGSADVQRNAESQRDSGTKPSNGVARNEEPWGKEDEASNLEWVAAPDDGNNACGCNPFGVVVRWRSVPRGKTEQQVQWFASRTARSSQHRCWAGGHNPLGIADPDKKQATGGHAWVFGIWVSFVITL